MGLDEYRKSKLERKIAFQLHVCNGKIHFFQYHISCIFWSSQVLELKVIFDLMIFVVVRMFSLHFKRCNLILTALLNWLIIRNFYPFSAVFYKCIFSDHANKGKIWFGVIIVSREFWYDWQWVFKIAKEPLTIG